MELADRPLFRIAILGFNQAERIIFSSMFALSERRTLRYCQAGEETDPDILLIDGDNPHAIQQLGEIDRATGLSVIVVGSSDFGLGVPLMHRPVSLAALFSALDAVADFQRASRTATTPASTPVIRLNAQLGDKAGSVVSKHLIPVFASGGSENFVPDDRVTRGIGTSDARTILIVGASPAVLKFMRKHFAAMGFEVAIADHGEQAISMIQDSQFHCVFIEMNLAGIGPFSTCRTITRSNRLIVFLFGREPSLLDRIRGQLAGAREVLPKPLDAKILAQAIKSRDSLAS